MKEAVNRICLNCSSCNSYAKGKYICDIQNYREIMPFDRACDLYIEITAQERQARKEFEETYPGIFNNGSIDFDSPDFDKMINRMQEIVDEKVYEWPEELPTIGEVDDSVLTAIPENGETIIDSNIADFSATIELLSELFLTARRRGLLRLEEMVEDKSYTSKVLMGDFISNVILQITDGTDPYQIAQYSLDEYEKIQEQDEYKKLVFSFVYQALRKLQGGESVRALKVLCWKYAPINMRCDVERLIENIKGKYK